MIYQPDVTESGALPELEGKAKLVPSRGILNDLDMASEFGSDGQVRLDAHQHHHITGTLPFMARDLLLHMQVAKGLPSTGKKQKPKNQFKRNVERLPPQHHLYRHDLESFFYILVWATTHYDLKKRERVQPLKDSGLQLWEDPNISNICAGKLYLFESQVGLAPFEDSVLDQWETVWFDWVLPLQGMFAGAFGAANAAYYEVPRRTDFDYETCGGMITFEKFMQRMGETPRGPH